MSQNQRMSALAPGASDQPENESGGNANTNRAPGQRPSVVQSSQNQISSHGAGGSASQGTGQNRGNSTSYSSFGGGALVVNIKNQNALNNMANYRTSVTQMGHPHMNNRAAGQSQGSTSQTNRRQNDGSFGRRDKSEGGHEMSRASAPQHIHSPSCQHHHMVNLAHQ